jgi:hypothetical protein
LPRRRQRMIPRLVNVFVNIATGGIFLLNASPFDE